MVRLSWLLRAASLVQTATAGLRWSLVTVGESKGMNTAALGLRGKLKPKRCSNGSNKHTALPGCFFQLCSSSCEGRGQSEGLDNTDVLF